jgi:uncharacterized membrane protein
MTTELEPRAGVVEPRRARPRRARPAHGRDDGAGSTLWVWGLALGLFVLYTALSVRRHERMLTTGYDLGIFEQAVRSYADGHLPRAEIKGPDFPLLGDHFSPVLALLAPVYKAFPTPVTLLVVQAALLAVAVVPLASWAQRELCRRAAVVVGLGFGLSWGIAQTVEFDFHEVAFAVPLLAFSVVALAERRHAAAVLWALPLLLIKEDLGLTVAVVGGLVAWQGQRLLGLATAAAGVAGTAVEMLVLLPHFNPAHEFQYFDNFGSRDPSVPDGNGFASLVERLTVGMVSPQPKATLLVMLLVPTALLALRSPLILLALPTLGWRLVSDNPQYWGTDYHYSAVLMPIVFVAFVDALRRWRHPGGEARTREALVASALVTAVLVPQFPLYDVLRPSTWKSDPRVGVAREVLAEIPDGVTVQASNPLVPQLTGHTSVSLFGMEHSRPDPDYILADRTSPWPLPGPRTLKARLDEAVEAGYTVVTDKEDFLLLRRPGAPTR